VASAASTFLDPQATHPFDADREVVVVFVIGGVCGSDVASAAAAWQAAGGRKAGIIVGGTRWCDAGSVACVI
jgi:hypothetical protein